MAESAEDKDSKTFEPTQRRLEKAREQGDSVRSEDLQAAISLFGVFIAFAIFGLPALGQSFAAMRRFVELGDLIGRGEGAAVLSLAYRASWPLLALLIPAGLMVLAWLIASGGLVFSPSKLEMRGSRLSVLANFRQKFGRSGLVDFLKKTAKMLLISLALTLYLQSRRDQLFLSLRLEPGQILSLLANMGAGFLLLAIALNAGFGLVDFLWQRLEFIRRNRMSRKELSDEMKDSEGDPHQKADRLRRAREVAGRKMLADVPEADVVVVNPTHYAVALKWDQAKGGVPVCVAKGCDEIALRIREIAREARVPIRHDPPTARALYAAIGIGEEIRPEHYAAVAAAIRFAHSLRGKLPGRSGGRR